MDKTLRNVVMFGILVVSLSIGYYLVLKPSTTSKTEFEACYNQCLINGGTADKACVILCGRQYLN